MKKEKKVIWKTISTYEIKLKNSNKLMAFFHENSSRNYKIEFQMNGKTVKPTLFASKKEANEEWEDILRRFGKVLESMLESENVCISEGEKKEESI
jgi:hypothetical protein